MRDSAAVMSEGPLLSRYADDPEMREIVALFVSEVPDRLRELQSAWDSGDMRRVRTLAHQIKGAAGGYGFPEISTAASALESAVSVGTVRAAAARPGAAPGVRASASTGAPGADDSAAPTPESILAAAKPAFTALANLLARVVMAG